MRSRRDSKAYAEACKKSVMEGFSALPDGALDNIEKDADYSAFIEASTALANDVKYSILSETSAKKRAKTLEFFVDVIREDLRSDDFFTASTILGSLKSSEIANLPSTQRLVSDKDKQFLQDLAYFLGSGKALAESEVSKSGSHSRVIPNLAALKSLYIAYAETINQNVKNIFQNWLLADPFDQKPDAPGSDIAALMGKKKLLSLISEAQINTKEAGRVREEVLIIVENEFRAKLEAYKAVFANRQPLPPTSEEIQKVMSINYEKDIQGKLIKAVDAALSLSGLAIYAKQLKVELREELKTSQMESYKQNPDANPEKINELYMRYKEEEKRAEQGKSSGSEVTQKSSPGDVLRLSEIGDEHKIEFLESALKSKEKQLADSKAANKTGAPNAIDEKTEADIKELQGVIAEARKPKNPERVSRSSHKEGRTSSTSTSSMLKSLLDRTSKINMGISPGGSRRGSSVIESEELPGNMQESSNQAINRLNEVLARLNLPKSPGFIASSIKELNWEGASAADINSRDILLALLSQKQANMQEERFVGPNVPIAITPKDETKHRQIDVGIEAAKAAYAERHGVSVDRKMSRSSDAPPLTSRSSGANSRDSERAAWMKARPAEGLARKVESPKKVEEVVAKEEPAVKMEAKLTVKELAAKKAPPPAPVISPLNKEITADINNLKEAYDSGAAKEVFGKIKTSDLSERFKGRFYSELYTLVEKAGDTTGLIGVLRAAIRSANVASNIAKPTSPLSSAVEEVQETNSDMRRRLK